MKLLAIHSCKGGVGKSTISVLLGIHMSSKGYKIGICDLDICGPSIVELLSLDRKPVVWKDVDIDDGINYEDNKMILLQPKEIHGIKIMSSEFLAKKYDLGYNAYRGPIIDQLCYEMIYKTNWDNLDYLILDLPPGTSDVIISLVENIHVDGSILITIPNTLSYNDVVKGIKLFQEYKIPIIAMVENMSYHKCIKCQSINDIFGKSKIQQICNEYKIHNYIKLPIITNLQQSINELLQVNSYNHNKHSPDVQSNSIPLAESSSPEVTTTVPLGVEPSSNYLSLKSRATPGDRGEGCDGSSIMGMMEDGAKDVLDVTSSGMRNSTGPQVEPVADLREAEGEVNKGAVCKTTSGGEADGRTKVVIGPQVEPVADLWEAEGGVNREGRHGEWAYKDTTSTVRSGITSVSMSGIESLDHLCKFINDYFNDNVCMGYFNRPRVKYKCEFCLNE